ncbi:MAG TPA: hypothetical protein ENN80_14900 [Candidatus Hydrogenedentes bacterium]|nr:hypothetical protein [Candidatus Hydrogenedentota bacterium]
MTRHNHNAFDLARAARNVDAVLGICKRQGGVLILMQNSPDPDAIASAAALKHILYERLRKRAVIGYAGICGRAENRAMLSILCIDALHVTPSQVAEAGTLCFVDCQPRAGNTGLPSLRSGHVVIDHHPLPKRNVWMAEFSDVRPAYGATSTILYEYLLAADSKITPDLAAALFYGIQSDTQDLGREAGSPDIAAFQELILMADKKKLAGIRRAPVPLDYFEALGKSLDNTVVAGSTVLTYVASHAPPDMMAEVADLMLRLEGMHVSLCYGVYEDTIHISARGHDGRSNIAQRLRRVCSHIGTGGGHHTMAGAQIPLSANPEKRLALVRERLLRVFAPAKDPKPMLDG